MSFQRHELVTEPSKRQTILTGWFLGEGAIVDLGVIDVDHQGKRHLRIYAVNDIAGAPKLSVTLRPSVLFIDVANIGGRDRLITYERGRLNWFDPRSRTERLLVKVNSNFRRPREGEIPHVDLTRDVNGDGMDDLLIPCADGFRVYVQKRGGVFSSPVTIGPADNTGNTLLADGYRYDPWSESRIHVADYNRDGLKDLVWWNSDHFELHLQMRNRQFAKTARTFTTEVAFDSDDLSTLAAPQGVRYRRKDHQPVGAMTGRVLHAVTDLNGDGIVDLGVFALKGGSPWKMHATYEVYFGVATTNDGTDFRSEPGTAIHLNGILYDLKHRDLNGDSQSDMVFTTFSPGVVNTVPLLVGSILTNTVPEDLEFFRMNDSRYPAKPNTSRMITVRPGSSGQRKQYPPMLIGDVNGDQFSDLLVHDGQESFNVFTGVDGPTLFARRAQQVSLPKSKREHTWLVDLNSDGKQDILAHHPLSPGGQRVTLLIAN